MNAFALNAAAINGSVEVWIDATTAAVELQSDGQIQIGITSQGTAQAAFQVEGQGFALVKGEGAATLIAQASADSTLGVTGQGIASIGWSLSGDGTRWVFGEGGEPVAWDASGSGQVVEQISAIFGIEMDASLEGKVALTRSGEGDGFVVLSSEALPSVLRSAMLSGVATIEVGLDGVGYAIVHSPDAYGQFELSAYGDMRLAEQVFGSGDGIIQLFARGSLGSIHYEYGEGSAAIEFDAVIERFGRPDLPVEYVPAPAARTFMVQKSSRTLTVQRDNRSL